ncbi:MAG: ABC transporter ATP-binding protein [Spirochaeta sp.]
MLDIQSATICYGTETAVENFSLKITAGEMVSIVGPSGCGKTSLLYAAAGLRKLQHGTIQLETTRDRCGLIFQDDRLLPWLTIRKNILLGAYNVSPDELDLLLNTLRIHNHAHKYPNQLSGGQRQRAAMARMLIRKPELLLLDEPFASLDEQTREDLQQELLYYVQSHHITMLLVTHSISEAVFLGGRIVIMQQAGFFHELENLTHLDPAAREQTAYYDTIRAVRAQLTAATDMHKGRLS